MADRYIEITEAWNRRVTMAEYIEKEAAMLTPVLPKEHRRYQTSNLDDVYEQGWADALDNLKNAPAADVAPVVHCKDCKHSYITVDARCCSYGAFYDVAVPDDFFCALAERKDGDSNVHSDQRPEKRN